MSGGPPGARTLAFRPRAPVALAVERCASVPRQGAPAGAVLLARHPKVRELALGPWRGGVEVLAADEPVPFAPLRRLARARGKAVLLLAPSDAVGDSVMVMGALRAMADAFGFARLGVAFSGPATDVWSRFGRGAVEPFPFLLPKRDLRRFDLVLDPLRELPAIADAGRSMLALDRAMLEAAGLDPDAPRWEPPRPPRPGGPRLAVVCPQASSPLRSLPPALVRPILGALAGRGLAVELVLDPRASQGAALHDALRSGLPRGCAVRADLATVGALLERLDAADVGVFCDSGPAHLAKLAGLRGLAVYSSVDPGLLHGGYPGLRSHAASYEGPFCRAPCGLALAALDPATGEVGCMDTLRRPREALEVVTSLPFGAARRLLLERPVGCVASLVAEADRIAAEVLATLDGAGAA